MKWIHRLVGLILILGLCAGSVLVLRAAVSADAWRDMVYTIAQNRLIGVCGAASLLCLLVVFALSGVPERRRERFLSFDSENGTVSISTEAISDYVSKLREEFPSIVSLRPKVIPGRRVIDIIMDVRVKAGPQIHEVCEVLQKRVREVMSGGLGISEVRRVEVSVKEISSEHKAE